MKGHTVQVPSSLLQSNEERTVTLKKMYQSENFVPVVIFIPASIESGQGLFRRFLGESSMNQIGGRELDQVLEKEDGTPKRRKERATVAFGDVAVDFEKMEAFRKKERVALTRLQFKALRYLTRHARRVISRDELLNEVWGYNHYPTTRTVDNIILKLRQKLEPDPSRPLHF